MSEQQSISILVVEDNPVDAEIAMEALQYGKLSNEIQLVSDGEQAMKFLLKEPPFEHATIPDLILLDLNLPGIDGREVLKRIRNNQDLRLVPVVVLTASDSERDILESYDLQVNNYIVKPVDMNNLFRVVRENNNFWLRIVSLMPKPANNDESLV